MAGERDGIVPVVIAEELDAGLGTPEQDKDLVVFPDVAHSCHDENPARFVESVSEFVETWR